MTTREEKPECLQCIHSENDSIVKAEALQRVISPFDERCRNCKKEDRQ